MILTLDNDLAALRTDFTDHFLRAPLFGFVPLEGRTAQSSIKAMGFNRRKMEDQRHSEAAGHL
jgi:hypothetical protein